MTGSELNWVLTLERGYLLWHYNMERNYDEVQVHLSDEHWIVIVILWVE